MISTEDNVSIKDLSILEIVPNQVDGVLVLAPIDGKVTCHIPQDMNGERYKRWRNGKGGLFFSDVKRQVEGKKVASYVLLDNGKKSIFRIASDSETGKLKDAGLLDGKLKDKFYTVIRDLEEGDSLTTCQLRYIKQTPLELELEINQNTPSEEDHEDSYDNPKGNLSLFTD